MAFPDARVTAVLGPTNTGKTIARVLAVRETTSLNWRSSATSVHSSWHPQTSCGASCFWQSRT
ncbi:MAG: hypothetical protein AAFY59_08790, partial [Pseudomonadota bacterium]